MGKVYGNWITGVHSGRACRQDDIYTKVNKKTGACYSVKLCNPNTTWSEKVTAQRSSFGAISSALSAWIKAEKEKNSEDYQKVKKMYDRQIRFSTLRGMMYAKGMYSIDETGLVTVDINANYNASAPSGGGGSSQIPGGSGGAGDSGSGGGSQYE
ncbi:MAG: hypothetical protein U0L19_07345 [Bacteroidales bacterium]|nr:hypothetical protein [Bacteroidales bacterium]